MRACVVANQSTNWEWGGSGLLWLLPTGSAQKGIRASVEIQQMRVSRLAGRAPHSCAIHTCAGCSASPLGSDVTIGHSSFEDGEVVDGYTSTEDDSRTRPVQPRAFSRLGLCSAHS